jgi:hypothetical protein
MRVRLSLLVAATVAWAATSAAAEATLFRIFLRNGGVLVSYGEFSRLEDRVIFSMPIGGGTAEPRLQVVWVAADAVDWTKTDRYAASARYQHYVQTRGETDFQQLNDDIARVLNEVAVSTDRTRALDLAVRARQVLVDWPRTHQGYRQEDVREIVGLIEEAISGLRASNGQTSFEIALVASMPPVELEPLLGLPSVREQLDQVLRLADLTPQPSERLTLLQTAQALLGEAGAVVFPDVAARRAALDLRIRQELDVERRYAELSTRLVNQSRRDASRGRVSNVEAVLARIDREDAKLGRQRPEIVSALRATVASHLDAARDLRLRRDQWALRQRVFQDYQRQVGTQILALVKAQTSLEAIRRLEGPKPSTLTSLRLRLSGGAERLERLPVAGDMRPTHDLVVGAWRFAENAVRQRIEAVSNGNIGRAWEASSAAAGALMMFARAQDSVREMLEPPKLR